MTTHESAKDDLAGYGVEVQDVRFVDDGTVLTASGVTSAIDLVLHLVERECSPAIAEQVAEKSSTSAREEDTRSTQKLGSAAGVQSGKSPYVDGGSARPR